uniref:Cytochrome c biogenesis protein CcsA n=1 Tax=Gronococcus sybilensis TaxID=3028029 RepID=A0A9Y1I2G9_9RHOD|nr:cytochrome c biogenesis protein [Gronococcus sybilensis]
MPLATEKNCEYIIFISLLLATTAYWLSLGSSKSARFLTFARSNLLLSNSIITLILLLRWISTHHFPMSNLYESLLFLGWALNSITLILETNSNIKIVAALGSPMTMLVIGFALLFLPSDSQAVSSLVPALKSNWLIMHVSVMILSYATLMIGSLLSIVFLVVKSNTEASGSTHFSGLTYKRPRYEGSYSASANKIPNGKLAFLGNLDTLSYRTIGIGFPLLTIGIISGAVWANEAWGTYWSWDPKETWALITWLVFAAYLHARINNSWQGKKSALIASAGFIVVWICYLGVNFLGKGLHSYGWLS